jgi:hypothetical protein
LELRRQEKIYFSVKDLENAERVRALCIELEKKEVDEMQEKLYMKLTKEETILR